MKLSEIGELGLIRRIASGCIVQPSRVVRGIGDDCSVTPGSAGMLRLVTTDLLIERVHFLRGAIAPRQLGWKALAASISDIAAMAGRPLDAYVSAAIPADVSVEFFDELYDGLKTVARRFDVNLLGGDTTGSKQDLMINVALIGEVEEDRVLYRRGAGAGDRVFVSGGLGDSRAGLDAILNARTTESIDAETLVRCHQEPEPHVRQGRIIGETRLAHAMIDVSDGLAVDIGHICEESGVGCVVEAERVPMSVELRRYCERHGLSPLELALAGGEDYVLLSTGDPELGPACGAAGVELFEIGSIVEGADRMLRHPGGRIEPLGSAGWDHFPA
ncbi:MAG: thiamine-phosphate kinase [Acidobacteriota bacterium]